MNIVTRTRTEVYHKWIAALISGKYKKTQGQLRWDTPKDSSFCCLGVLCDLAAKDGGEEWIGDYYMDNGAFLPTKIRKWMKLTPKETETLMEMNDTGKSFVEISKYIQKNILPKIKD